ncbi:hypothetical protein [Psychrobacter sp. Ps3]|nr:hypothetical protein [Psychrobacter sp. Ps3]
MLAARLPKHADIHVCLLWNR